MPVPVRVRSAVVLVAVILSIPCLSVARAQPPGGREGRGMFRMPLMMALDADGDGEISASEIDDAPARLRTLDANKDGKLTMDELRPAGGPGGRGGFGGGPNGGPGGEEMVNRLMEYDTDKDGRLKAEDLPERMRNIVARADADKDGFVTRDELLAMNRGEGGPRRDREAREREDDHDHDEQERRPGRESPPQPGARRRPPVEE